MSVLENPPVGHTLSSPYALNTLLLTLHVSGKTACNILCASRRSSPLTNFLFICAWLLIIRLILLGRHCAISSVLYKGEWDWRTTCRTQSILCMLGGKKQTNWLFIAFIHCNLLMIWSACFILTFKCVTSFYFCCESQVVGSEFAINMNGYILILSKVQAFYILII